MKAFKVYHLAEELGIDKVEAVEYFALLGVKKKNALATLDEKQAKYLREKVPNKMRAYKLAEEFGIHRNGAVEIFRALGFEIKNAMSTLDRDQMRFLRELFHAGSTSVAGPRPQVDSPAPPDLGQQAPESGICSNAMMDLGGADSLPVSIDDSNVGKQVVSLGTLIEALLKDILSSRGQDVEGANFLALINMAFSATPDELFPSVYRDSMHIARKIRNRKLHAKIGSDPPGESDFLKARNVFLVGVADLIPHLSPEVARAVLFNVE